MWSHLSYTWLIRSVSELNQKFSNRYVVVFLSTDYPTFQRVAPPHPFLALNSEDVSNTRVLHSVSIPEERLYAHHCSSKPLHSPSKAINANSQATIASNVAAHSPIKLSGDLKKPLNFSRTTSLCLTNPAEKTVPSQCSQSTQTTRSTHSFMKQMSNQRETQEKMETNDTAEITSDQGTALSAAPVMSTGTPAVPTGQIIQARRELFSNSPSHTPVRRTKSEVHVRVAVASAGQAQSAAPEVCTDATINDRLWSKLEPGSHRDSVSSSSSISSSDTVIDLSLPNLARKSLTSLPAAISTFDPPWVNCRHSALVSYDSLRVSKSKSNPNLQQSECPSDELKSRPLQSPQEASMESPSRLTQRRHTWSRLYMEGLKQSSASRSSAATSPSAAASMSKSLGDLTSDDISCNFDSKYRSISRSFIVRPTREQLRKGRSQNFRPPDNLTEQLRKLTNVEPLTASDFAQESRPKESQDDSVDETLVRRTSSRSQSRVRYIANRAKKAQERQRLQGRGISFSLSANPIEERGNPEGACCVSRSPCTGLDLLSQLTPLGSLSPRQSQSSPDTENSEVFFMLKLWELADLEPSMWDTARHFGIQSLFTFFFFFLRKKLRILYHISQKTQKCVFLSQKSINRQFCILCKIYFLTCAFRKALSWRAALLLQLCHLYAPNVR